MAMVTVGEFELVALIDTRKRAADVFEFLIHVVRHFRQSDHHRQNANRRNEHEFGGNDDTGFVVVELFDELRHSQIPFAKEKERCGMLCCLCSMSRRVDGRDVKQPECHVRKSAMIS